LIFINKKYISLTNLSNSDEIQFNTPIGLDDESLCRILLYRRISVSEKSAFALTRYFTTFGSTWLERIHSHRIVFHLARGLLLPSRTEESLCILSSKINSMVKCGYDCSLIFQGNEHKLVRSGVPILSHMHPRHTILKKPITTYSI